MKLPKKITVRAEVMEELYKSDPATPFIHLHVNIDGENMAYWLPFNLYKHVRFGAVLPQYGKVTPGNQYEIDTENLLSETARTAMSYWESFMLLVIDHAALNHGRMNHELLHQVWTTTLEKIALRTGLQLKTK